MGTLKEIKKDFEREERLALQQSQGNVNYRGNSRGGNNRNNRSNPGDHRESSKRDSSYRSFDTPHREKQVARTDQDGFTEVLIKGHSNKSMSVLSSMHKTSQKSSNLTLVKEAKDSTKSEPLSEEKLKLRAVNMRKEFMQDSNKENLLLSMDETSNTPDAGKTIVQVNIDSAIDCKEEERIAIISMISLLFTNGKLTMADIEDPMGEMIEFADSFIVDSPRALHYIADMVAEFLQIKALDVLWLCKQTKKLTHCLDLIPEIIGLTVKALTRKFGPDNAKVIFIPHSNVIGDLIGKDAWNDIAGTL